jgi:hypothetical protein
MHTAWEILSDHVPPPRQSICRHGDDETGRTYAGMVFCPQDQSVWATFGNPCAGVEYAIDGSLKLC